MIVTLRQLVVPTFLFLALVLGGSAQSVWGVLALQLLASGIIAWAVVAPAPGGQGGTTLLLLSIATLAVIGLQLLPVPPEVWTQFPGRAVVAEGYRVLGRELPWLPISLAPYATLQTILFLLSPIAVLVGVLHLRAYSDSWAAAALLVTTLLGILLGYLQISTGKFGQSAWYLYEETNVGSAVGFFANRNHMGTLLLMALPFVAALFFARFKKERKHTVPLAILGGAGVLTILLGIAINGSLAAVALAVPVVAASATLVSLLGRFRVIVLAAAGVALIGALIVLAESPVQPKVTGESTASFEGRQQIWSTTADLIGRTFPVGTGFGTFERVYPLAEPHGMVTNTYVNHAHNDFLELVLEGGLAAIVLFLVFLVWWARRAVGIFAAPATDRFAMAAVIASGAALAHSVVDYPLRTSAIAVVFAFCLALMARGGLVRGSPNPSGTDAERPARHEVIG